MTDKHEEILEAVIESRAVNHNEHIRILEAAEVSMKLSEDINEIKQNWIGFKKTMILIRNIAFTVGIAWLLFKDPFHSTFGG